MIKMFRAFIKWVSLIIRYAINLPTQSSKIISKWQEKFTDCFFNCSNYKQLWHIYSFIPCALSFENTALTVISMILMSSIRE